MWNHSEWGTIEYGGVDGVDEQIGEVLTTVPRLAYNGFSLANSVIVLKEMPDIENLPSRDISFYDNPLSDGQTITSVYSRSKTLTFSGSIVETSEVALREKIRQIKAKFNEPNGNLDILWGGRIVRYKATIEGTSFARIEKYPLYRADFEWRFTSHDALGEDTSYSVAPTPETITASFVGDMEVEALGSANTPLVTYLTWNAVNTLTSVTLSSNTTGQAITVTQSASAGDIWLIDGENKIVKRVNDGVEFDWSGSFIDLKPQVNSIDIAIASTTHNLDITYKFKNKYS